MIIPIRTDYRMTRTPWVNYALVAANVVFFLAPGMLLRGVNGLEGAMASMGLPSTTYSSHDELMLWPHQPQLVQFFTCMFMHAGWMHLIGNMLFLWVFGNALNDRLGQIGYLAFYLAGGLLAGVGYLLLSGNAPVLGASGAISAVTGAYLVLFPRVRVTLLWWFWFITYFEVSSLFFLLFQFVTNMYMQLDASIVGRSAGGVAYAAHSTGYVFGAVVAFALLAFRLAPRDGFDLLSLFHASHRRSRFRRMVSEGYDPFGRRPPSQMAAERRWVPSTTVQSDTARSPEARELELRREISEACARGDLPAAAGKYLELVQIADDAVLARQQQLDVANQLMSSENHPAAADAYERFLKHYGNYEHKGDICLMLGLLYGRYLQQYPRAERYLEQAISLLADEAKRNMALAELQIVRRRR